MQRFLLLLTALSPLLLATAGVRGSLEPYYKAASDCVKFLGICESRLEKYNRLVFPPDRDTMCFVRCVGLVLELWDDRNGTHWYGTNQRFDPATEQQIRRCIQSKLAIIDPRDLCSRAYYSLRCFRKHIRNVLEVTDFVSLGYVDDAGNVGDPPTILQMSKDDSQQGAMSDVKKMEIKNVLEDTDDVLGDDGPDNAINAIGVRNAVAAPNPADDISFLTVDGLKNTDKVYMFSVDKAGVINDDINVGVIDDLTADTFGAAKVDRAVTNFEEIDIVDVDHTNGVVVVDSYNPMPRPEAIVAAPKIIAPAPKIHPQLPPPPPPMIVPPVEVIHRTTGFIPLTASQVILEISKCMDECGVSTLNMCAAAEPLRDIPPIHCVTHCAALRTNVYCDRRGPLLENLYVQLGRCESEQSFRRRLELCFRRRCQPPGTCPQAIAYRQFITCVQNDYERFFSSHADELVQLPIFTKFCW
ncbi:uncharacterized protein LOC129779900 [Toxorhynchites rutilus septentrionalis]|uniref:uncharacterized protein LOC129779900 n=1 Tax=Toxorhynchites rutilus septentrionalis TaxID=329112 RepID=UPI002479F33A|nr:uncharacterized protein LOC129779900 [Toxorhynchites rutilus septentrionalis]